MRGLIRLAGCCVLVAGLFACNGMAQAATKYVYGGQFTNATGAGLSTPSHIGVDQRNGNLFVVDRGNNRIRVYAPDYEAEAPADKLTHLADFGSAATIQAPTWVAVDSSNGDVYVAKTGSPAGIVKFNQTLDPDGEDPPSFTVDGGFTSPTQGTGANQVGSFGTGAPPGPVRGGLAIGRHPSTNVPILLVADPQKNVVHALNTAGARIDIFPPLLPPPLGAPTSTFMGQTSPAGSFNGLLNIATNDDGDFLIANISGTNRRYEVFDSAGGYLSSLTNVSNDSSFGVMLGFDGLSSERFVSSKSTTADIFQFDDDSSLRRSFSLPGATGFGAAVGMAVDSAVSDDEGRLYVATNTDIILGGGQPTLQIFEHSGLLAGPPTVSDVTVASTTPTSASVEGIVQGDGAAQLSWRFEYRRAGQSPPALWTELPLQTMVQPGEDDHTVSSELTGLLPNREYEVRLYAVNENEDSDRSDNAVSFVTAHERPGVTTGKVFSPRTDSAVVAAWLNTQNADTKWWIEYGESPEPGFLESTAPETVEGTDSTAPQRVWVQIEGLSPGVQYWYRVVARNEEDETDLVSEGDFRRLLTRSEGDDRLPDREFELVSQIDSNGLGLFGQRVSEDGDSIVYGTGAPVPGAENISTYQRRATRQSNGHWKIAPFASTTPIDPESRPYLGINSQLAFDRTLRRSFFETLGSYAAGDQNGWAPSSGGVDVYSRDSETGQLSWHSGGFEVPEQRSGAATLRYVAPDGNSLIYSTSRPMDSRHQVGTSQILYQRIDGINRLISVLPGAGNAAPGTLGSGPDTGFVRGAVSDDGERVAFTSPTTLAGGRLYIRLKGGSGEDQTVEATSGSNGLFAGADRDMRWVFYGSQGNLVRFDVESGSRLTLYDKGELGDLLRVLYVSDDGRRVYFVAGSTQPKIYLAELTDGGVAAVREVSQYDLKEENGGDSWGPVYSGASRSEYMRQIWANPTGDTFIFRSSLPLVPGSPTNGALQLYVYEARLDALSCASCHADPARLSNHSVRLTNDILQQVYPLWAPHFRNVLADGSVYFETASRLVDGDTNFSVDVYEWRGGNMQMVSAGKGRFHSVLGDVSSDGRTVLFSSTESLVPGEYEAGIRRAYVARIGGGAPREATLPDCTGDDCRISFPGPPEQRENTAARRLGRRAGSADGSSCAVPRRRTQKLAKGVKRLRQAAKKSQGTSKRARRNRAKKLRTKQRRLRQARAQLKRCRQA